MQLAFDHHHWGVFFHLLALGARIWGLDLECRQRLIEALASVGPRLT